MFTRKITLAKTRSLNKYHVQSTKPQCHEVENGFTSVFFTLYLATPELDSGGEAESNKKNFDLIPKLLTNFLPCIFIYS